VNTEAEVLEKIAADRRAGRSMSAMSVICRALALKPTA
jgi:hypothetical protein